MAACGSGGDGEKGDDSIVVSAPLLPSSLDYPFEGTSSIYATEGFMSTLVDFGPQPEGEKTLNTTDVIPSLAESWETTPEGQVFTLRDATAPSGNKLTPEDVVYTYERLIGIEDGIASFLMGLAGIDTSNPVTVLDEHRVRLNGNIAPLGHLGWQFLRFSILDSKLVKEHATKDDPWANKWLSTNTATFGAYSASHFEPNKQLVLKANPHYWGGTLPYQQVTVLARAQGSSATQLLDSGTVHWATRVSSSDLKSAKTNGNLKTTISPQLTQDVLALNQAYKPFADVKVRQAMSLATDRKSLLEGAYGGLGDVARTVGSRAIPAVSKVEGELFDFDLDRAKQLMAESSYPDGFTFEMAYLPSQSAGGDLEVVAVALQKFYAELGIKLVPKPVTDFAQFDEGQRSKKYQAFYWGEGPILADGAYAMNLWHVAEGGANYTGEADPDVTALIKDAMGQPLGDQRDHLVAEAADIWNSKMYSLPMIDTAGAYIAHKDVCGFGTYPYQNVLYKDLKPCS